MTADQKLDLLEAANRPQARHAVPSSKLHLIVVSADQRWLNRWLGDDLPRDPRPPSGNAIQMLENCIFYSNPKLRD